MRQLSPSRITRLTLWIGAAGTAAAGLLWNRGVAFGFLTGSLLSLITTRSWIHFAESLAAPDPARRPKGLVSAIFLILRYMLFAAVVYVMMKYLGSSPVAILAGLLCSFAAVVVDFLHGSRGSGTPSS